jgi:hypothetical protein
LCMGVGVAVVIGGEGSGWGVMRSGRIPPTYVQYPRGDVLRDLFQHPAW